MIKRVISEKQRAVLKENKEKFQSLKKKKKFSQDEINELVVLIAKKLGILK